MRKCTAAFLLAIFLFSNTHIQELGKIGAFIGHFQEHRIENPEITLLDFIQVHYFNGNVHDEDYDRDMQLPFKVLDSAAPGFVFTLPSVAIELLPPAFATVKKQLRFRDQSTLPSSHLSDIWQPPKSC